MKRQKQKSTPRRISAILLVAGLTVSGGLFALSFATAETILPGVAIDGVAVGGLRGDSAKQLVAQVLSERTYTFTHAGRNWSASPAELGVTYHVDAAVDQALRQGRNVVSLVSGGGVATPIEVERSVLEKFLAMLASQALSLPVNADFEVRDGLLAITPDRRGALFDVERVMADLKANTTHVALTTQAADPDITAAMLTGLKAVAEDVAARPLALTIESQQIVVPNATILTWMTAAGDDAVQLALDEAKVGAYLQEATKAFAKQPVPQRVLKSEQRTEVYDEGAPGRQLILSDAVAAVSQHVLSRVDGPVQLALTEIPRPVEYVDAPPAPVATGKVIGVDLTQQHAYVYHDSRLVYSLKISSGINDWTPTGTFKVYAKTKKQKMSGPGYYVPNVPNILWFKGDYSMHGVYWHNDFGIRPRSHGCVGQSVEDSEWVYNFGEVGTPIFIYKS